MRALVVIVVGAGARTVPHVLVIENAHVLVRPHPVRHRPHHHVEIFRIDVLVDRDRHLADRRRIGRGAVERAPHFGVERVGLQLNDDQLAQVGQRFVHEHARHAADVEVVLQVMQEGGLVGHALDQRGFARRHLADDRDEHRVLAPRDRRDIEIGVVLLQVHVAVRFAEASLRLQPFGVDEALDDDFGSAGTIRSTVLALHTRIGAPTSPPATESSSRCFGNLCTDVNVIAAARRASAPPASARRAPCI